MIKAILFDLDGVLVNMPDGHYEALNKTLNLFGTQIEREEHVLNFNGLPTRKKVEKLQEQGRLPNGLVELINSVKQIHTKKIIPKYCVPDYSKIILLKQLKKKGYKLACCSNSVKETLHLMLKSAQLFDYFDFIIGNDEVVNSKPDPEIYLKTFEKMGLKPNECIIVEDAPPGVEAAKRSGGIVYQVKGVEDVNLSLFKDLLLNKIQKTLKLSDFTKGWIIGDFDLSILKTKDFEVAIKYYKKGDLEPEHVHKIAREITVFISGIFKMNGKEFRKGEIMVLDPSESSSFECLEDGFIIVIKTPSVVGDKYIINK
ncbi:MAG: HAD family phosphatase [Candidatus Magasanikbacteria bacterium]|nr:HAD family phosphatase [Candidatus Magasanikbacteria bacterium]